MQSRNFIQYEGNLAQTRANRGIDGVTRKWQVVTNPHILAERRRRMVTRRARRLSRILSVVTAGILVGGLVMQISMMMMLNAQSKAQDELYAEIKALQTSKRTVQIGIANLSTDDRIEKAARALGFDDPQDSQMRALGVTLNSRNMQLASAQP